MEKIYLILSSDYSLRSQKITEIINKNNNLLSSQVYYGDNCDLMGLAETWKGFSFSGNNIIVLKNALNLTQKSKEFICSLLKSYPSTDNYLVFDVDTDLSLDEFKKKYSQDVLWGILLQKAKVIYCRSKLQNVSLGLFVWALRQRKKEKIFSVIHKIYQNENFNELQLSLSILGIIIREYVKINYEDKKRVFPRIWDTERQIKEGKLKGLLAVELLLAWLIENNIFPSRKQ